MTLGDYLAGNDLKRPKRRATYAQFAVRIGVSTALVGAYCQGAVWPGRDKMEAIFRETGGRVTANDFLQIEGVAHG